MIHSIKDYSSLASAFEEAMDQEIGHARFLEMQREIADFWELLEKTLRRRVKNFSGVTLYQDSLPAGDRGKILQFFNLVANDSPDSPNFVLVKKLLAEGSILEGTEDFTLVAEQLNLCKLLMTAPPEKRNEILEKTKERATELVHLRDKFIARRIRDTLPKKGKGIIFMGRHHNVPAELENLKDEKGEKIRVILL